jgi:hypothetical protein
MKTKAKNVKISFFMVDLLCKVKSNASILLFWQLISIFF